MYINQDYFRRLKRGFNAYCDGVRFSQEESRIHQFIRAVEAVIKPEAGASTKQFAHRGQLFLGRKPQAYDLLFELYELRSRAEHLNDIEGFYSDLSTAAINKRVALRSFQSQLLAGYVYRRICENIELRKSLADDQGIQGFWKASDAQQARLWGPPLDIEAQVEKRFNKYL